MGCAHLGYELESKLHTFVIPVLSRNPVLFFFLWIPGSRFAGPRMTLAFSFFFECLREYGTLRSKGMNGSLFRANFFWRGQPFRQLWKLTASHHAGEI